MAILSIQHLRLMGLRVRKWSDLVNANPRIPLELVRACFRRQALQTAAKS